MAPRIVFDPGFIRLTKISIEAESRAKVICLMTMAVNGHFIIPAANNVEGFDDEFYKKELNDLIESVIQREVLTRVPNMNAREKKSCHKNVWLLFMYAHTIC